MPNGAAFEDAEGLVRRPADRCTLLYAGYFFGSRSPGPLLRGAAELLRRRPELRDVLRLRFMGGLRPRDHAAVAEHGARRRRGLRGEPALPRGAAGPARRRRAGPADAGRGRTRRRGVRARQDLGVPHDGAPDPGRGAARRATRPASLRELEAPATIADPERPEEVAAALEALVERWRDGGLPDVPLPAAARDRISRRARAEALAGLVRRAVERAAPEPGTWPGRDRH